MGSLLCIPQIGSSSSSSVRLVDITSKTMADKVAMLTYRTLNGKDILAYAEKHHLVVLAIAAVTNLTEPVGLITIRGALMSDWACKVRHFLIDDRFMVTNYAREALQEFIRSKKEHDPMCRAIVIDANELDFVRVAFLRTNGFHDTGAEFVDEEGNHTGATYYRYEF